MLDNLKLGYGGTKTEMERLLQDASELSGVEYNIESFADIVAAIHVIQESMDIAGTTAKEAEHTISGSINSLSAAIKNLVVGFGDANADIEKLCTNVSDAFEDVLTNIFAFCIKIRLLCQIRTQNRIQLFVPILRFLLLFSGIFAI